MVKSKKSKDNTSIIVAIIAAVATIVTALIGLVLPFVESLAGKSTQIPDPISTSTPLAEEILFDNFANGSKYWETGVTDNDYKTMTRSVEDNVFRWQVIAKQNVTTRIETKLPPVSDFDLEVILNRIGNSYPVEYGIQFRRTDAGSYYFFVGSDIDYVLKKWSEQDGKYITLINWTPSSAINLNGENKFRIYAIGDRLRIYINDILLGDIVDNSFRSGTIEVAAWLDANETIEIEMSSFKLTVLSPNK